MSDTVHQPIPVEGYKPVAQQNVDLVNRNKVLEEIILRIIDELSSDSISERERWLSIARTDFQKAFMSLNRAIFQPTRVHIDPTKKIIVNSMEISIGPLTDA